MNIPFVIGAFLAGAVLPLQTLINGRLAAFYGSPVLAAATSFQIGAIALFAFHMLNRSDVNTFRFSDAPIWLWCGGLLGTVYMIGVITSVPKLGATSVMSLLVLGQICASIPLDHYGILSEAAHSISIVRFAGALLVLAGVWLVIHY